MYMYITTITLAYPVFILPFKNTGHLVVHHPNTPESRPAHISLYLIQTETAGFALYCAFNAWMLMFTQMFTYSL